MTYSAVSQPFLLLIGWFLIVGVTAWCSAGWLQPDEHARILEPAHMIAYGYASLPWELQSPEPIVSWLLGVLFSPLLMVTKQLQLDGLTEAAIVRFVVGIFGSTRFIALWKIFDLLGLKSSRRTFYLAVMMLAVFGPLFLVRSSQENLAATTLVWALLFALRINQSGLTLKRGLIFGSLLALTFSFRPQAGVAAAGLGLWMLRKKGTTIIFPSALGVVIGLLPLAIADLWTTGAPFLPVRNYLLYALDGEGGGKIWGTSPWWYYIPQFFESWYPPLSIFLVLPIAMGFFLAPELGVIFWPFMAVHFILGHKETRYFLPMIPFMQLAMFVGLESIENRLPAISKITQARLFWVRTLQILAVITVLAGLFPMNTSPWMYTKLGGLIRSGEVTNFTYIGNTTSSFSQFYAKLPDLPTFQKISWNDVRDGKETPSGWLAFYTLDPEDFLQIQTSCHGGSYHQLPQWLIDALTFLPRSPARRRINAIIFCPTPLKFTNPSNLSRRTLP